MSEYDQVLHEDETTVSKIKILFDHLWEIVCMWDEIQLDWDECDAIYAWFEKKNCKLKVTLNGHEIFFSLNAQLINIFNALST